MKDTTTDQKTPLPTRRSHLPRANSRSRSEILREHDSLDENVSQGLEAAIAAYKYLIDKHQDAGRDLQAFEAELDHARTLLHAHHAHINAQMRQEAPE